MSGWVVERDEGEGFVQVKKINEERKTSGKEKFSFLF